MKIIDDLFDGSTDTDTDASTLPYKDKYGDYYDVFSVNEFTPINGQIVIPVTEDEVIDELEVLLLDTENLKQIGEVTYGPVTLKHYEKVDENSPAFVLLGMSAECILKLTIL